MIQRFDKSSAKKFNRLTFTPSTRYRENGGILENQIDVVSSMTFLGIIIINIW
jgi:hypothetical protein